MTDQINDQISAFIDNELSADESALLVRRFERDPDSRKRAMRYTLIGASLRGELLEPHPPCCGNAWHGPACSRATEIASAG
jgi:negative regulator of sigma E activity